MSSGVLASHGTSPATAADWRDEALCRSHDAEAWFPIGTTGTAVRQIERAKAICWECPVRPQCLDYALDRSIDDGVWGGLSEAERTTLKRRNSRARARGTVEAPRPAKPRDPVPAENTRAVIGALRAKDQGWEAIGRRIGISESTARHILAGTQATVWRSVEDRASVLRERVSAG